MQRKIEVGIIEIRGEEAHEWLQGQVTADVRELEAPVYTLLLTPQGRCLSDGWVVPKGSEAIDFIVPAHAADDVLARLDRFLVMEDVELSVRRETLFDTLGRAPSAESDGDLADASTWEQARIEAGIPEHGRDFGADTLPQEAGLRRAISFEKGCYIGQEPVVMLEHRGQPPRRLVRVRTSDPGALPAEIVSEGSSAGRLTSWANGLGLALVKRKRLESDLQIADAHVEVLAILGDED